MLGYVKMYRICRLCLLAITEAEEGTRRQLPFPNLTWQSLASSRHSDCRRPRMGVLPRWRDRWALRHPGREIARCERSGKVETLDAITAQCLVHLHRRLVLHALGYPAAMDTPDDHSPAMMSPPSPATQEPTRNHPRIPSTVAASRFRFIDPSGTHARTGPPSPPRRRPRRRA